MKTATGKKASKRVLTSALIAASFTPLVKKDNRACPPAFCPSDRFLCRSKIPTRTSEASRLTPTPGDSHVLTFYYHELPNYPGAPGHLPSRGQTQPRDGLRSTDR